ncbi:MAG: LacI family DNA-binding transcriptional regulator [Nocardioidaceae bacterium]|nr:LacI family DNA-binding transcriptional regulator [Nocardioidaceae bacterium]
MGTIGDVAKHAGVSTTTVSRHLAGQKIRSAAAVQASIEALDFRASHTARSLKSGVTRTIGLVVPDVSNPFFATVAKGVESVSRQLELNVFLSNTDENVERERNVLEGLIGRVDGVILVPAREGSNNTGELRRAGVPIVLLDRILTGADDLDSVLVDSRGGAEQAAKHLMSFGHERIGLISGPLDTTPGRERHDGFVEAMQSAGVDLEPALVQIGDFRLKSGYQATLRLLGLPTAVTAIFSANNLMTIGVLRALRHMAVRVPDEVSVVGFDDLELAELLSPPLSVISRPAVEQGVLAMRLLRNRMEDEGPDQAQHIVLDTFITARGSCANLEHPRRLHRKKDKGFAEASPPRTDSNE